MHQAWPGGSWITISAPSSRVPGAIASSAKRSARTSTPASAPACQVQALHAGKGLARSGVVHHLQDAAGQAHLVHGGAVSRVTVTQGS
jgi:hypothetical protein